MGGCYLDPSRRRRPPPITAADRPSEATVPFSKSVVRSSEVSRKQTKLIHSSSLRQLPLRARRPAQSRRPSKPSASRRNQALSVEVAKPSCVFSPASLRPNSQAASLHRVVLRPDPHAASLHAPDPQATPLCAPLRPTSRARPDCLNVSSGFGTDQYVLGAPPGHRRPDSVPTGAHVARVRKRASFWVKAGVRARASWRATRSDRGEP
ncbi:hypothetical protein E5676_scaffold195G00770 [Cucumis melo var. makuwa]|uniref:Uncharacterized protein n=1 Tax=Cucumis melo var. makuwa TaxID=1194695 RepID=A0A5D3DGG8_CUCMM|nr:hypothetical protein E5676_scaffold195G00770 [Cucumis melo var. makuwa]